MAKIIITIEDEKSGGCHVAAEFTPAPEEGGTFTNAQWSAAYMIEALNKELNKPSIFKMDQRDPQ